MENLKHDIETLRKAGCPFSPGNISKVHVWTIYDGYSDTVEPEDMSFHPDGQCGCCPVDTDEAFGIRCIRLMWMTGEHELFGNDGSRCSRGVMVIGNHKGKLVIKYLCEIP